MSKVDMHKSTVNIMYVLGTIMLMMSLAMIGNTVCDNGMDESVKCSGTDFLVKLVMPDDKCGQGTLFDRFCYENNVYYGLRG